VRLITLLESGQYNHSEDLATALGVSRSTLFRDLKGLSEAGVPCRHLADQGYRSASHYFLPPTNIDPMETLALTLARKLMTADHGQPLFSEGCNAINKLLATVPKATQNACLDLISNVFVQSRNGTCREHDRGSFFVLLRAIDERNLCRLTMHRRESTDAPLLTVEPHALQFKNRSWYLAAWHSEADTAQVIELSNIKSVTALKIRFDESHRHQVINTMKRTEDDAS